MSELGVDHNGIRTVMYSSQMSDVKLVKYGCSLYYLSFPNKEGARLGLGKKKKETKITVFTVV